LNVLENYTDVQVKVPVSSSIYDVIKAIPEDKLPPSWKPLALVLGNNR
jgi:hypothetical protein